MNGLSGIAALEEGKTVGEAIRIVGCGRWSMSDDRAGLLVAERLLDAQLSHVSIRATEDPLTELASEDLDSVSLLLIVDAALADASHPPGTFASFLSRK